MSATCDAAATFRRKWVKSKRKASRYRHRLEFLEREVLIAEKETLEKRLRELRANLTNLRKVLLDKRNDRNTGCDETDPAVAQQRQQRENERKRAEIEELKKRKKMEDELKVRQDQEKKERIAQFEEDTIKRDEDKALRKRNKETKKEQEARLEREKKQAAAKKAEEERILEEIEALKKQNEEIEKANQAKKDMELKEAAEKKKRDEKRKLANKKAEEERKLASKKEEEERNKALMIEEELLRQNVKLKEEKRKQDEKKNKDGKARVKRDDEDKKSTEGDRKKTEEEDRKKTEDEKTLAAIAELQKKNGELEKGNREKKELELKEAAKKKREEERKLAAIAALEKKNEEAKGNQEKNDRELKEAAEKEKKQEERKLAAIAALEKQNKDLAIGNQKKKDLKEAAEKEKREEERKLANEEAEKMRTEAIRIAELLRQNEINEEKKKQVEKKKRDDEDKKNRDDDKKKKDGDKKKIDEKDKKKRDDDARKNKSPKVPSRGNGKGDPQSTPRNTPGPTPRQGGEGDRARRQRSLLPRHFNNLDKKSCYANCGIQCLLSYDELRHNLRRFGPGDMKVLHNLALDFEAKESPYRYDVIPLRMVMGGDYIKDEEDDTMGFVNALSLKSQKVREQMVYERNENTYCRGREHTTTLRSFDTNLNIVPYVYCSLTTPEKTTVSIQELVAYELGVRAGFPGDKCNVCQGPIIEQEKKVINPKNIFALVLSFFGDGGRRFTPVITGITDGTPIIIGGAIYFPIAGVFHRGEKITGGHYYCYIKNGSSWTLANDELSTTTIKDWPKPCKNLSILWLEKLRDSTDKAPVMPAPSPSKIEKEKTIRRLVTKEPRSCPGTYFDNRTSPEQFVVTDALQSVINIDRGIHLKWDADVFHDIVLPPNTFKEFIELAREAGNGEFIGKLFGYPLSCIGVMVVTHLMIPNQTKHRLKRVTHVIDKIKYYGLGSDIWSVDDELDAQAGAGLGDVMQVGWMRAKTSGECLMSPRDLHRQAHYQKIQKDSVGVICNNIEEKPIITCYTLTEFGMRNILLCSGLADERKGEVCPQVSSRAEIHEDKHEHSLVAEIAKHVAINKDSSMALQIKDLRLTR